MLLNVVVCGCGHCLGPCTLTTIPLVVVVESFLARGIAATIICFFMSSSLNYYQPHKRRILFWLTQISFALTAQKYVMAMTLVTVKDDPVRLRQIEFVLITLDLYVDQKTKCTFCSDVSFRMFSFRMFSFRMFSFRMFSFRMFSFRMFLFGRFLFGCFVSDVFFPSFSPEYSCCASSFPLF